VARALAIDTDSAPWTERRFIDTHHFLVRTDLDPNGVAVGDTSPTASLLRP